MCSTHAFGGSYAYRSEIGRLGMLFFLYLRQQRAGQGSPPFCHRSSKNRNWSGGRHPTRVGTETHARLSSCTHARTYEAEAAAAAHTDGTEDLSSRKYLRRRSCSCAARPPDAVGRFYRSLGIIMGLRAVFVSECVLDSNQAPFFIREGGAIAPRGGVV